MIAKVVSSDGGGASGLAGYISERGRDASLEGPEPRPLFTSWRGEDRDGMSVAEANAHLAGGDDRVSERSELLHLIVSLTEKEFEALGDTNADRIEQLKGAIRDGMREVERELGVEDLRYAAGIHLNTANPHVHIAVQKEAPVPDSERTKVVNRLPRSLFRERSGAGLEAPRAPERVEASGDGKTLVTIFERAVVAREAPVRLVQFYAQGSRTLETRAMLQEGERQPTDAERLVGRWLVLETAPARDLSPHERRDRQALTAFVRALDDRARKDGRPQTAAFVERDRLRGLVFHERVRPLDANGAAREPYARRDAPGSDATPDCEQRVSPGERDEPLSVLGKEVALRLTVEHLAWRFEVASRARDTRRVRVPDATHGGVERELSARDITARSEAAARRAAGSQEPATAAERDRLRERELQRALEPHRDALERIDRQHRGYMAHLAKELASAREMLAVVVPDARRVRSTLRAGGAEARPSLGPRELGRLQEEAVERGDAKAFRYLEGLRPEGQRAPEETARLLALALVARADERLAERRSGDFEATRHLRRYEVDGQTYSLASAERLRRSAERERAFHEARADGVRARLDRTKTWTHHGVITAWKRDRMEERERGYRERAAELAKEADRFESVRAAVAERIAEDRSALRRETASARDLSTALETAATAERSRLEADGLEVPHPAFTDRELRRLEEAASTLRDPRLLAVVDEARARDSRLSDADRAARAEGRAIAAAVELEIAMERERAHREGSSHMLQLYSDGQGADRVATIRDVEPKGWWGRATNGAFDSREARRARADVYAAEAATRTRLEVETRDVVAFAAAARDAAHAASLRTGAPASEAPKPLFTPREAARIEAFAEGEGHQGARARYKALVAEAIDDGRIRGAGAEGVGRCPKNAPSTGAAVRDPESPERASLPQYRIPERQGTTRASPENETNPVRAAETSSTRAAVPSPIVGPKRWQPGSRDR